MRYEIRPLGPWVGATTPERHSSRRFRAPWSSTLDLLGTETELLGATLVVLQVDVTARDVRRDGMLRSGARVGFPGVRVSFDSRHGPLTYATDAYEQQYSVDPPAWQANIRAIALALEALRAVDRYGVSRSGEQYRGWSALPAGSPAGQMSADDAARLLAGYADGITAAQVLADPDARARAFKQAARRHHPDFGGEPEVFARLTGARDLLDATAHLNGGGGRG